MRCLIVSDTHGNSLLLNQCLNFVLDIDLVIHLGDNYIDQNYIIDAGFHCITVPGTWCTQYQDPLIDNRRIEEFNGWRCLLSHTPSKDQMDLSIDLDPKTLILKNKIDVMMHGHTHKPAIDLLNGVLILNPGHLKSNIDRGYRASYAVATFKQEEVLITIFDVKTNKSFLERNILR